MAGGVGQASGDGEPGPVVDADFVSAVLVGCRRPAAGAKGVMAALFDYHLVAEGPRCVGVELDGAREAVGGLRHGSSVPICVGTAVRRALRNWGVLWGDGWQGSVRVVRVRCAARGTVAVEVGNRWAEFA